MLENLQELKWIYDKEIPVDLCEEIRSSIGELEERRTIPSYCENYKKRGYLHLQEINSLYEKYYELKLRETPLEDSENEEL